MATDRRILVLVLTVTGALAVPAPAVAAGPTGWDAYRRVDLLPLFRTGEQARLASSYDRRGGNRDGGPWSCRRVVAGRCVLAEHVGPGEVDSIWTTRPRAGDVRRTGTIRVELDGRRVLDAPLTRVVAGRLGAPFLFPAVASARQASGAVWIKVPMAFRQRMRITTARNPGYFRVNYRTFDYAADGVTPFDPTDPAGDVSAQLRAAGTRDPKPAGPAETYAPPGRTLDLSGPGTITELRVDYAREITRADRVRIAFDGRRTVDAPVNELLGSGLPARVRSLMSAQTRDGQVAAWWPMPFRTAARISLEGPTAGRLTARVSRDPTLPAALARGEAGYLRATSRRGRTARGRPWRVIEARGPGLLVGLSATLEGPRSQRHLEGDETIVADGRALRGTGTEDFFEGGFYWFFGTRSLPLAGSPAHRVGTRGCPGDCRSMYRWLIADAVPFTRSLRFTLEHGDRNRIPGRYSTTALWYGR